MKRHILNVDGCDEDFFEIDPGEMMIYPTWEGVAIRIKNSRYLLKKERARKLIFAMHGVIKTIERAEKEAAASLKEAQP